MVTGAASLLLLTACTPMKSGSAAIVGDQSLTEADVADISDEVVSVIADAEAQSAMAPADLNQRIVSLWVDEALTNELAANEGVAVTEGDIDKFLEQFDEAARLKIVTDAGIAPSQLEGAAEAALLRDQLAAELAPGAAAEQQSAALADALVATADDLGVSVNPRFGVWNPTIPGVEPRATDRLSTLAGLPGTSADQPSPGS